MLKYLQYNCLYLHANFFNEHGTWQRIYLVRHKGLEDNYYLKIYLVTTNAEILQGYLYFTLNFETSESKFIGIYIADEFRSQGLASLLIATWIQLVLENEFKYLSVNQKQRKPFLLYLLKKFNFEITDLSLYDKSSEVIYICFSDSNTKQLFFQNENSRRCFEKSHIMRCDNYEILNSLADATILDKVLPTHTYLLQNKEQAYQKCLKITKTKY